MAIIPLIYYLNTWAHFTVHFQYGLLWWSKRTRSLYHILLSIPQITEAQVFSPRAPVAPHQTVTDPVVRLWIHSKKKKKTFSEETRTRLWMLSQSHESKHLPDICRQRQLQSPTNRRLFLCPRLPTAHRAPPSLCSRCRRASASVRSRRVDWCFCGLWQTRWETWWRWL